MECVFSGAEKEVCCVRFFWSRKGGVLCAFFLEQKKRVKPCVVRRSFSAVLLQQKKKGTADNPGFFSVEERQPDNLFFGYIFSRKVFLFRSDSEDGFRVRSSSICLDLRLDMPIIFIHYI